MKFYDLGIGSSNDIDYREDVDNGYIIIYSIGLFITNI